MKKNQKTLIQKNMTPKNFKKTPNPLASNPCSSNQFKSHSIFSDMIINKHDIEFSEISSRLNDAKKLLGKTCTNLKEMQKNSLKLTNGISESISSKVKNNIQKINQLQKYQTSERQFENIQSEKTNQLISQIKSNSVGQKSTTSVQSTISTKSESVQDLKIKKEPSKKPSVIKFESMKKEVNSEVQKFNKTIENKVFLRNYHLIMNSHLIEKEIEFTHRKNPRNPEREYIPPLMHWLNERVTERKRKSVVALVADFTHNF